MVATPWSVARLNSNRPSLLFAGESDLGILVTDHNLQVLGRRLMVGQVPLEHFV